MSAMEKTVFARTTVLAESDQPLDPAGGAMSWGPDWRIGERSGRWAILYLAPIGQSRMVRVEWNDSVPLLKDWEFSNRVREAALNPTPDEQAGDRDEALDAIARFDAMAVDLWERRDV